MSRQLLAVGNGERYNIRGRFGFHVEPFHRVGWFHKFAVVLEYDFWTVATFKRDLCGILRFRQPVACKAMSQGVLFPVNASGFCGCSLRFVEAD